MDFITNFRYPISRLIPRTSKWLAYTWTDRPTDRQTWTQAMTIPEGQNWQRVKIKWMKHALKMQCPRDQHCHDDVIKWKHFPRNWPFVREIHRSPVNFPHKGQWRGALMFSLMYAWINDWVNNREVGDLRLQHGHYDVIVMVGWEKL